MEIGSKDCQDSTNTAGGADPMIYLLGRLSIPAECRVDLVSEQPHFLCRNVGEAAVTAQLEQLVRDIERGDDGRALGADDLAARLHLAQLAIEIVRGGEQRVALVFGAGDAKLLAEDGDGHAFGRFLHQPRSRAFRRSIIDSMRSRAMRVFSSRRVRSACSASCSDLSVVFSCCSRWQA